MCWSSCWVSGPLPRPEGEGEGARRRLVCTVCFCMPVCCKQLQLVLSKRLVSGGTQRRLCGFFGSALSG